MNYTRSDKSTPAVRPLQQKSGGGITAKTPTCGVSNRREARSSPSSQKWGGTLLFWDTRPTWRKKSPAPLYHAATKAVRKAFWEAYATFVAAFREAADRWREGDRSARFPIGSFPPGLPFVKAEAVGPP